MIINNLLFFIGIIGNIIYMFFCLHFLFIFLWHVWLYVMDDYIYQKIKNPALMTQAGYHRIPKWTDVTESSCSWLSDWLCLTLYAQTRVQWLATPLSWPGPLQLASRGWSGPAILPTWNRTENLTVISPTPTPTNLRWLW